VLRAGLPAAPLSVCCLSASVDTGPHAIWTLFFSVFHPICRKDLRIEFFV
jgi:hypothetical protein